MSSKLSREDEPALEEHTGDIARFSLGNQKSNVKNLVGIGPPCLSCVMPRYIADSPLHRMCENSEEMT